MLSNSIALFPVEQAGCRGLHFLERINHLSLMGGGLKPKAVHFRVGNIFPTFNLCLFPKGRGRMGFITEERIKFSLHRDVTA